MINKARAPQKLLNHKAPLLKARKSHLQRLVPRGSKQGTCQCEHAKKTPHSVKITAAAVSAQEMLSSSSSSIERKDKRKG